MQHKSFEAVFRNIDTFFIGLQREAKNSPGDWYWKERNLLEWNWSKVKKEEKHRWI